MKKYVSKRCKKELSIIKWIKNRNINFWIVIFNFISVGILIFELLKKQLGVIVTVICVSFILLSIIYLCVNLISKVFEYIKSKLFKYETQNLHMLVFNNKWDLNPTYDCLSYISKNPKYSKKRLDYLLNEYRNFNDVNSFELYQEFINSLCSFSMSELKTMNSFLNIKFDNKSLNLFNNNLFISIFLFVLVTFFGIDVRNGKVDFNSSYLYKIFELEDDFSVKFFIVYVICVVILFILLVWIVKRKQKRTTLITLEAIKQAIELKELIQKVN